ncbi:MAG: acyltransferase [Bacteroidaceae bacterium]|nr:acyltransferase [Bacteroidaceae bacterium]
MFNGQCSTVNGFEALRWLAALTVVVSHFFGLAQVEGMPALPTAEAVQLFFILSGMLTYRSLVAKPGTLAFYKRRARRILPAYWSVILFCLLVGLLFTEIPLRHFVTHPQTGRYLLWNALMLNRLQPALPGVFETHVNTAMDGALWTMKYEVAFYLLLPAAVLLLRKWDKRIVFATGYVLLVIAQFTLRLMAYHGGGETIALLCQRGVSQAVCFWSGMIVCEAYPILSARSHIAFPLALALAVLGLVWWPFKIVWPLAYAVLILIIGTRLPLLNHCNRLPRITYEIFLIHFPIIQVAVEVDLPQRLGTATAFSVCLLLSLIFASLLHHTVGLLTIDH